MIGALKLHIKPSTFQVLIWRQCLIIDPCSSLADPDQLDWQETDSRYSPIWTILLAASKACQILFKCGCKKYCKGATNEIVGKEECACFTFITP